MTIRSSEPLRGDLADAPDMLLIGVDHHCAPIELREKVTYDGDEGQILLQGLEAAEEIAEACLISTCNRTEIYLLPNREAAAYRLALERVFLDRAPEIEAQGRFYVKRGVQAARHLLEVAGGLRSMVLGEPEILGQVRKAARQAEELETSGTRLRRLLRAAVAAGGRVRYETAIGAGAISFGYAVVDLAQTLFERLDGCSVLMLGAGATSRQVARNLLERGVHKLVVTNRSPRRLEEFLSLFPRAHAVPFSRRRQAARQADVIVVSTAADEPVLRRLDVEHAMAMRRERPLLVADLGVPRNVEAAAGDLPNVFLRDIDSLESLISQNLERRHEEVPKVRMILDRELDRFLAWHSGLDAEPIVELLQKRAEETRRREVASIRERFPAATHPDLDRLSRSLVRKLLHHPSARLRAERSDYRQLDVVRHLFRLDED